MKFTARKAPLAVPGVTGTARVGRPTSTLLPRLQPGDIAVIDHVDLDRETATALVEAGVVAVVNAAAMISGRYANLGPEVLDEAGIIVVDQVGSAALDTIHDAQELRLRGGVIYAVTTDGQTEKLTGGRLFDLHQVQGAMGPVRSAAPGPAPAPAAMDTLAHTASDLLASGQEVSVSALPLPELVTPVAGRAVVVVAQAQHPDLQSIRQFVREQSPVVVAVGAAADDVLGLSWVPDVVIVTAGAPSSVPSHDALRIAADVVLVAARGSSLAEQADIEALGIAPRLVVDSSATAEDVALLLADRYDATLVVGVGLQTRLEDLLDSQRAGQAVSFATRLKVGSRLVDADAVRALYSSRASPMHVALVLLAGLVALLVSISVTPVGQDWADSIADYLKGLT
jgi:uncharacterized membrane-anchored protein